MKVISFTHYASFSRRRHGWPRISRDYARTATDHPFWTSLTDQTESTVPVQNGGYFSSVRQASVALREHKGRRFALRNLNSEALWVYGGPGSMPSLRPVARLDHAGGTLTGIREADPDNSIPGSYLCA